MNRTAYLYGAESLLGQEIGLYLLKRGLTLAAQFSTPKQTERFLADLPDEWRERCIPTLFLPGESGMEAIDRQLESVASEMKGLDLYIHAAGWQDEMTLLGSEPEDFAHHMVERLRDLFFSCRAAGRVMVRKKKGQMIIPLLSDALYYADFPSSPVYNQGAIAFVKSLAKELSPFGISMNAFEFGFYRDVEAGPLTRETRKRFDLYALKPPVPHLADAVQGLGMLLDYGQGMSGQTVQWGYGIPQTM